MKWRQRGAKRAIGLLTAAVMLFSFVLSGGTALEVKAGLEKYMGPQIEDNGNVTFYYQGDGTEDSVYVKGSWSSSWDDPIYMTKGESNLWSVTTDKLSRGKAYDYGIMAGTVGSEEWKGDNTNPTNGGNARIQTNPVIDADGKVTLYYYPEHGSVYPSEMKVSYRKSGSTDSWIDVPMTRDTTYTAVLSAAIQPEPGTYEYKFTKDTQEVSDKLAASEQKFKVVNYPAADPNVKSPVIDGTDVTFNYYGPANTKVQLAGSMSHWQEPHIDMDYNAATGYWSITKTLSAGDYQYKFVVDGGSWTTDPLNANTENGNSVFTIAPQTNIKSPVVNNWGTTFNYYAPNAQSVYLAGDMNGWDKNTTPMIQDKVSGWWTITLPLTEKEYEYKFVVDGDNWVKDSLNENTNNGNSIVTVGKAGISPVVKGTDVTFVYPDESKVQSKVRLAGSMTGWQENAEEFTYNSGKKQWELTKKMIPGKYEYKFILEEDNWINDPSNTSVTAGGNNILLVSGLSNTTLQAEKGTAVNLPETVKYYSGDEKEHQVAVTYTLPVGIEGVSINAGKITVDKSFTGSSIAVTMKVSDYEAVLTVIPVDEVYNYTIYYYDKNHQTTDSTDLWIWENNGAPGAAYDFTGTEVLSDGNTWLKAQMTASYKDMGMIPRSKGEWSWQGATVSYININKDKNVTLYLVADDATAYTELPEIKEVKDRYVMVEYVRPANDYTGWSLYTWDSGFGSEVSIDLTEMNGKHVFIVPIKKQTKSLSFVVRRSEEGNEWAEKDGGDNNILTPSNQTITKAVYTQGKGISFTYPENRGFQLDTKNHRVGFFYRDDDLVLAGNLKSLKGKVQIEVDGNVFDMIYDEDTDRFVYYYEDLTEGDHYYRYNVNGEFKLDAYNDRVETKEALTRMLTEYSVYTYKTYDATATAEFSEKTVDYTQNSVLKVNVNNVDDMKVTAVTADISALGGSKEFVIDPQLMAGTVAVKENVKAGTYTIPVIVKDQYENEYKTSADITVTKKTGSDFDWDEAIIYFMLTDRFMDGNTSNNAGVEKDNPSGYHGGDFAGVTKKLDYLKDLGINTIWITPIVDNIDDALTTEVPGITSHGYHGYWAKDFTALEERLGTEQEFETLINEAHDRGIKIMVDVVLNHAGYNTEGTFGDMIRSSSDTVAGDAVLAPLAGMPDFATEKAEVRDKIVAWQTAWITKYNIDYFRVDTVKHVENTTWKAFKNSLTEANPEFKMIGEYAGAGYTFDGGQMGTGQMDSLLDFDFNDFGQRFVTGDISQIEKNLEERNTTIDNTATLGSFLSSHDEDGLVYKLINENGMTEKKALEKMMVAASLQITAKGQPVIYYGEEIGLYGANNYPYQTNRYDFDWSKVTKDNAMLNHYKTLLSARNTYTDTFAKGERTSLKSSNEEGYLVFDRVYNGQHVVTALNITDEAKTVTFDLTKKAVDEVYTNLLTAGYWENSKVEGNTVTLTIPPASEGGTYMFAYADKKSSDNTNEGSNSSETLENTRIKTGDTTNIAGLLLVGFGAVVVMAEIRRRKKYC